MRKYWTTTTAECSAQKKMTNKMQRLLLCMCCLFATAVVSAQDTTANCYRSPLPADMPILLSANFGELRGNHFHAGLDFRVGGVPGAKLHAVAGGYVSRIVVSPEGYGKAVYINHPNGTTSVYGHLHAFSSVIKKYIENIQYNRQRFAVDVTLDPATIPVKKGDIIGIAGNSGSSFGAHLHFELRKTATQAPFNTLSSGIYKTTDNIAPAIQRVVFYKYEEENEIPVIEPFFTSNISGLQKTVDVPSRFFIAVDASDRQNGTGGKFDINRMEVKLDDTLIFSYRIDEFSFSESRYINSLIAYDYLSISSHPMIKTYVEPGNKLSTAYETVKENGIITLRDNEKHRFDITVYDDYNNRSSYTFTVQQQTVTPAPPVYNERKPGVPVYYNRNNQHEQDGMRITIPAGSLYRSIYLTIDTAMYTPAYTSSLLWNIHNSDVPLHTSATLHLRADVDEAIRDKALIVAVSKNGGIKATGGTWENDGVTSKIAAFGNYCVMVDTTAPAIRPLFKKGADLRKHASLSIKISDELSGISTYKAFIDGEWALMDYDAKKNVLNYTFDPKRIKRNTKHTLLLTVTDKRMNTAGLETTFTW